MILAAAMLVLQPVATPSGEEPVEPYAMSNANAGARPATDPGLLAAWKGLKGIDRVVEGMVRRSETDPRTADIFKNRDGVRLRRTLKEQFCYLLGGGCDYSGRTMKDAHKDMGLQNADLNALVEHLQEAMADQKIPFWAQNRLLAKLAPMRRDVVER